MNIYNKANPVFGIPYDDVKSCNINTVLTALNSFLDTRERVIWHEDASQYLFEAYDDDSRDVWNIPQIRQYVKKLDAEFPYWFYCADLTHHS